MNKKAVFDRSGKERSSFRDSGLAIKEPVARSNAQRVRRHPSAQRFGLILDVFDLIDPHRFSNRATYGVILDQFMKGSALYFGHLGGNTAMASTSNNAPGRASCGTPIVVLAGGAALFTYLSRTSR